MRRVYGDVVLITGASSGIGKEIARTFMNEGYRVYGTTRKALSDSSEHIERSKKGPGFIRMVQLDVRSEKSVKEAVNCIIQEEGSIDILINNAGFGIAGSIEDSSTEEAFAQFDTNFFGVHRMVRYVMPLMRKQRSGLIVNISSVAGQLSIPFQAMYSASKYAVEALSEALRIEARHFGIRVVIVEPGDTRTGFTGNRQNVSASGENSAYRDIFKKSIETMIKDETGGPGPEKVAKSVIKLASRKNPPVRITIGLGYKTIVQMKRFLPVRFIHYVISKIYS